MFLTEDLNLITSEAKLVVLEANFRSAGVPIAKVRGYQAKANNSMA
jgi:hypothetical protein